MASLTSAGYRMYYDERQLRVFFSGLRVGDTLEVAFLQRDIAARNMFDQYFGDIMPLAGLSPRLHVEYRLEAPKQKPIYFNVASVHTTTSDDGEFVRYAYEVDDVAAIKPESGMPGWTETAPYLHASTYLTWNDVGNWYWDLVEEQLVVDEDIRAAVQLAIGPLGVDADVRAKTDALYEYVVRNTRYVGLEFGIHGYKPYRTTEVLSRRFGDCKDKASLLKVMLGEAGIEAHLVLVRTRDQGTLGGRPASLAVFNHAIVYVPSLDLFLDGTAEWSGPAELPGLDQGATVLVVQDGRGADFRRIPISGPEANRRSTEQTVHIDPKGAARIDHVLEVEGASAAGMRQGFQAQEQRNERLAEAFGDIYPGVQVTGVTTPGIGDILHPARVQAELDVPKFATEASGTLRFPVLGRHSTLATSLASASQREHPLVLDIPSVESHRLDIRLPTGFRFVRVPSATQIDSKAGSFRLEITPGEGEVGVHSELTLRAHRIEPSDYGEFRSFLRRVDEALEQTFEFERAK